MNIIRLIGVLSGLLLCTMNICSERERAIEPVRNDRESRSYESEDDRRSSGQETRLSGLTISPTVQGLHLYGRVAQEFPELDPDSDADELDQEGEDPNAAGG